jgi:16S rRNA (guanine966-N2)-methyltransferase
MRVVAGTAGGRRLVAPPGRSTRPTSDRTREAVFNALGSQGVVEGASVADLFAGSGALGIEALSRGAASAVFVEHDRRALEVIRSNLAATGLADAATVVAADVERWLAADRGPFDLVLADPPYAFDRWPELLARVRAGAVVAESDRDVEPGPGWRVLRRRRYGGTVVTVLTSSSGADEGTE